MSMNPFDIQMQQLAMQEPVVNAMRMQSMAPIENVSASPGGQLSIAQVLAKVLQGHVAGKSGENLANSRVALAQRMREDAISGVDQFHNLLQQDPQKAIAYGDAHHNPVVQAIAKRTAKGMLTPKDLAKAATPDSLLASGGNPANFVPKQNLQTVTPGHPLMNKDSGQIVTPYVQPGAAPTLEKIDGNLYQRTATGLDQINKAPTTTVSTNVVNGPAQHGMKEFFGQAAKKVAALGDEARGATNTLRSINELKQLEKSGIFSNATSSPATFVSNLAQAFGMPISDDMAKRLGGTESYNAAVTDLWQTLVSKYGGNRGVTKEEAEQIKNILPRASHSPEGRMFIMETLERAANRQLQDYQKANKSFAKAAQTNDLTELADTMSEVFIPNSENTIAPSRHIPNDTDAGNSVNKPMELEDYLKKIGVK